MTTGPTGDKLFGVKAVAETFNICSRGVWRMVSRGELPQPVHVGRSARWFASDIERYMERLREGVRK
jgi:predicted DNA-binding transcriptional regulator AlpA